MQEHREDLALNVNGVVNSQVAIPTNAESSVHGTCNPNIPLDYFSELPFKKGHYMYACAKNSQCDSDKKAITQHWTYRVNNCVNGIGNTEYFTIGRPYLEGITIDRPYVNGVAHTTDLCPPDYVFITEQEFSNEIHRELPKELKHMEYCITKLPINLDKFGMKTPLMPQMCI